MISEYIRKFLFFYILCNTTKIEAEISNKNNAVWVNIGCCPLQGVPSLLSLQ